MKKKEQSLKETPVKQSRARLRRAMEALATFGLIIVAVGLVAPISFSSHPSWMPVFKWIYAAGAVVYFVARLVSAIGRDESLRVRRLRRMEVWAGICLLVAGFFWFYNTSNPGWIYSPFKTMQETIVFTLAGALIQVVASWMLSSAQQKEMREAIGRNDDKGASKKDKNQ